MRPHATSLPTNTWSSSGCVVNGMLPGFRQLTCAVYVCVAPVEALGLVTQVIEENMAEIEVKRADGEM